MKAREGRAEEVRSTAAESEAAAIVGARPARGRAGAPPVDPSVARALQARVGNRATSRVLEAPVQLKAAGPPGRARGAGAVHAAAAKGVGRPAQAMPHGAAIQRAFGHHDVSSLSAHVAPEACGEMGAAAYATGSHVVFGRSPSLFEAAHEAAHAVQQRSGRVAAGSVGRVGDAHEQHADAVAHAVTAGKSAAALLDRYVTPRDRGRRPVAGAVQKIALADARVDAQLRAEYDTAAAAFERRLGNAIRVSPEANAIADVLLARVQRIVDAWAAKTGQGLDAVYEEAFKWDAGNHFWGAFHMSAQNIRDVFADAQNKPLRSKLKLIYNAANNNNISKWLKVAAQDLVQGKPKVPVWHADRDDAQALVKVGSGFARASGLDKFMSRPMQRKAERIARDEYVAHGPDKEKMTEHRLDRYSKVLDLHDRVKAAYPDRADGINNRFHIDEQRTLDVQDVPDLTDAEVQQLKLNSGGQLADATSAAQYLAQHGHEKLLWEQGWSYHRLEPGTHSARIANRIKAHLESGISGSTDLMLHVGQYLGASDAEMSALRLAMLGWMLPQGDHSFYEIMKAAKYYGLEFHADPNRPGAEYEDARNFAPMTMAALNAALGAHTVFPSQTYSQARRQAVRHALPTPLMTTAQLRQQLAPRAGQAVVDALDERGLAHLDQLDATVTAAVGGVDAREDVVHRTLEEIRRAPAVYELAERGQDAKAITEALVRAEAIRLARLAGVPLTVDLSEASSDWLVELLHVHARLQSQQFDAPHGDLTLSTLSTMHWWPSMTRLRETDRLLLNRVMPPLLDRKHLGVGVDFFSLQAQEGAPVEYAMLSVGEGLGAKMSSWRLQQQLLAAIFAMDVNGLGAPTAAEIEAIVAQNPELVEAMTGEAGTGGDVLRATLARAASNMGIVMPDLRWVSFAEAGGIYAGKPTAEDDAAVEAQVRATVKRPGRNWQGRKDAARAWLAQNLADNINPSKDVTLDPNLTMGDIARYGTLTDTELYALHTYTLLAGMGGWHGALERPAVELGAGGGVKRKAPSGFGHYGPLMKAAIKGLEKLPVGHGPVYNGVQHSFKTDKEARTLGEQHQPGSMLYADSFLSAARSFSVSFGVKTDHNVVRCIHSIKTGRDIQALSGNEREQEVLFKPGARLMYTHYTYRSKASAHPMAGKLVLHYDEM